mgnify:CR=1 FL=1
MRNKGLRHTIIAIIVILVILTAVAGNYLYATRWSQGNFKVDYQTVDDTQIPDDFDNVSMMFFSDLEFGSLFDAKRLDGFSQAISGLAPDIVVFGGDMFDQGYDIQPDDITAVTSALKAITAPLGKFAILGDFDQSDEKRQTVVKSILLASDFELLGTKPLKLHNGTSAFIELVGISYDAGLTDASPLFADVQASSYVITAIHGPALADALPLNISDLTLSGHAHHMQVNIPGLGAYTHFPLTASYGLGRTATGRTLLYLSHGIGETNVDARWFCDPSVLFFRFNKK